MHVEFKEIINCTENPTRNPIRMSWGRDFPFRTLIFHLLHSIFVPCFSYLHFTVYLPTLFCFVQISSSVCGLWTLTLLTQTYRKCHDCDTKTAVTAFAWASCYTSLLFYLFKLYTFWDGMLPPICAVWRNTGFNPHWFWPYYKHIFTPTWPI